MRPFCAPSGAGESGRARAFDNLGSGPLARLFVATKKNPRGHSALERRRRCSMRTILGLLGGIAVATLATGQAAATAASESEALKAVALDYIEGYYTGDAARMERALHPELAKRIVNSDGSGHDSLGQMSAMTLVNATRAGGGKNTPADKQQKDVTVLDVFENAAVVKVVAADWVDYLEMARWNGQWKIVNVLWELKPEAKARRAAAAREKK